MHLALLLRITATLMLFVIVAINVLLLTLWGTLGILDSDWSFVPLWLILVALIFGFGQFMVSSFLLGVSQQVVTKSGAEMKDLPLSDRLSHTIDVGWQSALQAGLGSLILTSVLCALGSAIWFNDLVFLASLHTGMSKSQQNDSAGAEAWYRKAVWSAGADRLPIARFLLAGSLVQSKKLKEADAELHKAIQDPAARDNPTLLVFLNTGLANCDVLEEKFSEAEAATNAAIDIIEKNQNLPGIELRLIGSYKQNIVPDAPPVTTVLRMLEDIYIHAGKCDLALSTFERILQKASSNPKVEVNNLLAELAHLERQLSKRHDAVCVNLFDRAQRQLKAVCAQKFKTTDDQLAEKYKELTHPKITIAK